MKLKNFLCLGLACVLTACTASEQKNNTEGNETTTPPIQENAPEDVNAYARDTSPGRLIPSSIDDMIQKMKDKKTFTVAFTLNGCIACERFDTMFADYKNIHAITLFQVNLDEQSGDAGENRDTIVSYFPDFGKTPAVYYVQNGEIMGTYDNSDITEETFEKFVTANQIDIKE